MRQVYLTKDGIEALKSELKKLVDVKRPALVRRVAVARGMGDLSENSEYTSAREELGIVDGRIEELEAILAKAQLIKGNVKNGKLTEVTLGCKVTVKVAGASYVYNVVGEWEADPANKKISNSSPLGKALLGRKKGEKVEIEAPAGKILYQIVKID
jgi:transcription elongation factor GreA